MHRLVTTLCCITLAACASSTPPMTTGALLKPSPECESAKLQAPEPMPVGSIPDDVLRQAKSGWVSVRYDVISGRARNVTVVSSEPPGLYDSYVVRHASRYTEPTGVTVRGCIATTNIKF